LTDRVVVPTEDQTGLNAHLAEHFGRAPYFAVVDLDDNKEITKVETVTNMGEHLGGVGLTHDNIAQLKPNAIVAYGMGPRGINSFQSAGITVLKANADTVNEVIAAYKEGKLQVLAEGCEHAHHH